MDKMDRKTLEKYSCAFSLSDMELYIFPELLYALVLANIMSERVWRWKEDAWFNGIGGKSHNYRLMRLKQFIMERYVFNLDLETWGLTTKSRELARFEGIIDSDFLARSNALFGYEGDKYYFDIDIRRHFGLDKYGGEVIPYWKTETVEAMDAFRLKPGHSTGAGECVSLAALYAAALYVVLDIPLDDVFLMATPLHSQNFILGGDGVLTNNRRLVTKNMWFNGSALSAKARRALENERVTVLSHITGNIHVDYARASIDRAQFSRFKTEIARFLTSRIDFRLFAGFLRQFEAYRKYFQFEHKCQDHVCYLPAETLYRYEHSSRHRLGEAPTDKLLLEVEGEEFSLTPLPGRNIVGDFSRKLNERHFLCRDGKVCEFMKENLIGMDGVLADFCRDMGAFACVKPRLPEEKGKNWIDGGRLEITPGRTREEIAEYLSGRRKDNEVADLAFYAGRSVDRRGAQAFVKACIERSPVAIGMFEGKSEEEMLAALCAMPDESVYDGTRLALPDEVVNFGRGDGLEKALVMADVLRGRGAGRMTIEIGERAVLKAQGREYVFPVCRRQPELDELVLD